MGDQTLLDFFRRLAETGFLPQINCLGHEPGVVALFVGGNIIIAAACYVIPICLAYIVWKRKDLIFNWMFILFGVFLLASGMTCVMNVVTLYDPVYRLSALVLVFTALASVGTCVLLLCLIPQILKVPGPGALTREVQERKNTERKLRELHEHLEERVRERTAELESRNEDLSQFAFAASHDLQEPLRMMAIYCEVLNRRYRDHLDDEARIHIEHIVGGARRMSRLLEDLLLYTRLARDNAETAEPSESSAESALIQVLADLKAQIDLSEARITWSNLPVVQISETHLRQILQNLINNAIKYRSKDRPAIHISSLRQGEECLISIKDNGIGIGPRYHRQIFGVFKRLHGREVPGTGMGLPICQRIVERYGGRIWVESEVGIGSTFFFRLPSFQVGRNQPAPALNPAGRSLGARLG